MVSGGVISVDHDLPRRTHAVEEMLCRGVILRSFLRQYGRWPAIVGSALLFGVSHMNIYQCVAGFITGVVLGWLYERTRSLWPCILLHASYNTAVTLAFDVDSTPSPALWMLALVLACAGTLMLRRLLLARSV